ncbi:hypothetical protein [Candidatus Kryptobacter tengchongensis]|uniref:WG containing repeat-containing protein n=1 Tax=Kryptobacter tengchongensis TaxID=1643429 RepID=A0A916PEW4_KRYT1|nr:hypothetical protein [Candidatus Kryptobacter tengchongensis]CUT05619.1 hypothetical protein JGI25_01618 [Candidatus Kryptobacter tengchongensis]
MQKSPVVSLKVDESGKVYTYCPGGVGRDEMVIYVYDNKGELVNKFGQLPKFMWDFPFVIAGGGMIMDSKGFIYQVHPVEYVVNKYSRDGTIVKKFKINSSFYKAPYKPDLKTIQMEYQKWLDSWTPVSGLYLLNDSYIVTLLSLGKDKKFFNYNSICVKHENTIIGVRYNYCIIYNSKIPRMNYYWHLY